MRASAVRSLRPRWPRPGLAYVSNSPRGPVPRVRPGAGAKLSRQSQPQPRLSVAEGSRPIGQAGGCDLCWLLGRPSRLSVPRSLSGECNRLHLPLRMVTAPRPLRPDRICGVERRRRRRRQTASRAANGGPDLPGAARVPEGADLNRRKRNREREQVQRRRKMVHEPAWEGAQHVAAGNGSGRRGVALDLHGDRSYAAPSSARSLNATPPAYRRAQSPMRSTPRASLGRAGAIGPRPLSMAIAAPATASCAKSSMSVCACSTAVASIQTQGGARRCSIRSRNGCARPCPTYVSSTRAFGRPCSPGRRRWRINPVLIQASAVRPDEVRHLRIRHDAERPEVRLQRRA